MPVVKMFERLDLEQICLFLDRHQLAKIKDEVWMERDALDQPLSHIGRCVNQDIMKKKDRHRAA
ncbi:MAG: hypothetical protein CR984_05335 [Proteobacteria bacterium]|nr:MAG: hypothetical protein CR984_05335 [Pseudomonadota bacterium]